MISVGHRQSPVRKRKARKQRLFSDRLAKLAGERPESSSKWRAPATHEVGGFRD
jgi:hypothetical protein